MKENKDINCSLQNAIDLLNLILENHPIFSDTVQSQSFIFARQSDSSLDLSNIKFNQTNDKHLYSMRLIGFLNGLFGEDENGNGYLAYEKDEQGNIVKFCRSNYSKEG